MQFCEAKGSSKTKFYILNINNKYIDTKAIHIILSKYFSVKLIKVLIFISDNPAWASLNSHHAGSTVPYMLAVQSPLR